ncbi:chloromuconate cycloisomerase [Halosimplex carlsbadense 2-9-1]|uniref:o-succinylbenzoate synthase n=1 Tax=Halosimplex carlsbadense 2-9-1 TaxID=797114 RepID=M0CM43_9EURY|nr:o-succinylbenzoate synthase [Halosimplex carlsbadense]ELZ24340.1 chloromuconate cycloisomerase [Halosimplex carlsbadense 2-9-1]
MSGEPSARDDIDPFSLPLESPLATAAGEISERSGFLVRYDHRGERGVGEATPLPGWTESLDECETGLERALDAGAGGAHSAGLLEFDADEIPAARHGFATALLDADARADGIPLYRWFDDSRTVRSVPVNATVGDGDPETTVEHANEAVEDGFDCLKCKVGARSVDEDIERVRAVREAVGDRVTLRLDANGGWSRAEAERAIERVEPLDVAYVEQPVAADDLAGLADLRGNGVDIAVDEGLVEHSMAEVFAADAADVAILKPMVLGGPGNAQTLALRARDRGIEPVVTTTVDAVVARTAAVHVAAAIPDVAPCGLATAEMLATDLADDPAPVSDGRIAVPQDSGLGVEIAEGRR